MQQINNQNPAIINEYHEYPYYYYQFPPNMYGFPPPYFPQYIEPPKNLQENLNMIYQRGIVNNIIGAFFIKEYKEKKTNNEKRKVPISMVELGDEQDNNNKVNDDNNKNDDERNKIDNIGNNKSSINENNDIEDNNEVNKIDNEKNEDNYNEEEKNIEDKRQNKKEGNNNSNTFEKELKKPDIIF